MALGCEVFAADHKVIQGSQVGAQADSDCATGKRQGTHRTQESCAGACLGASEESDSQRLDENADVGYFGRQVPPGHQLDRQRAVPLTRAGVEGKNHYLGYQGRREAEQQLLARGRERGKQRGRLILAAVVAGGFLGMMSGAGETGSGNAVAAGVTGPDGDCIDAMAGPAQGRQRLIHRGAVALTHEHVDEDEQEARGH